MLNTGAARKPRRARISRTMSGINAQLAALEEHKKLLEAKEAERIVAIATRTGLFVLQLDQAVLEEAFRDMAARFRNGQAKSIATTGPTTAQSQPETP